jgi:hypothetical protein
MHQLFIGVILFFPNAFQHLKALFLNISGAEILSPQTISYNLMKENID